MEPLSAKMREMGYQIEEGDDSIRVYKNSPDDEIYPTSVKTSPYPGFPTDLQPQTVVLLCMAQGQSRMHEECVAEQISICFRSSQRWARTLMRLSVSRGLTEFQVSRGDC